MMNTRIWVFTVFREHRRNDIYDNVKFRLICSRYIDEDIARVQRDFAMLRVDDRWHRQNLVLSIVNNGIHRGVPDNVQIS